MSAERLDATLGRCLAKGYRVGKASQLVAIPLKAFCHVCDCNTPTMIFDLGMHAGNVCGICGTTRKGRPYVSKELAADFFKTPMPNTAEGDHHAKDQTPPVQ